MSDTAEQSPVPIITAEQSPVAIIKIDRASYDVGLRNLERLLERLDRGAGAREVALAKTKLEEAKMWLGKALRELKQK